MKTKLLIMISLISWAFMTSADDGKTVVHSESETVEITVDSESGDITKRIIVNGKELSAEEILEFEASGKMKTIHIEHGGIADTGHKVIMLKGDGLDHESFNKKVKVIKTQVGDVDDEEIEVFIDKVGDKVTEKIIVNGKELSEDELKEFKASGKMKVIKVDSDMVKLGGNKMMFINSDSVLGEDIDIEVIMDKIDGIKGLHGDGSMVQEWVSENGKNIKIIKKSMFAVDDDSASLGFVANVEDDGWHLTKILDKSGAKDVGILAGDIVTKIAGIDLISNPDSKRLDVQPIPNFEEGEIVKVELKRAGQPITFDVPARMLDKSAMTIDLKSNGGEHFEWIEKLKEGGDFSSNVKVMVFDGKDGEYKLNEEDIHMVFPESLGKMNFFVSDGKSTSKLLGKHHEMSSLSDGLSKYFHTKGGVLVLHVDDSNVFNLTDGDVIKSINGNKVDSPKDVVKQLIKADDQEKIKMSVVRNKKSKTLKYEK
jgi:hypothetical protein